MRVWGCSLTCACVGMFVLESFEFATRAFRFPFFDRIFFSAHLKIRIRIGMCFKSVYARFAIIGLESIVTNRNDIRGIGGEAIYIFEWIRFGFKCLIFWLKNIA